MVEQTVQDGGGDDRVAENRAPFAIAFVAGEHDAAPFIAGADELKEYGRPQIVERQIAHLIDHEDFGGEVDAQAPVEAALPRRPPQVADEFVGGEEVRAEAGVMASVASATLRCVFPTPGGPRKITLLASCTNRSVWSSRIWRSSMLGWKLKSNWSRVLVYGRCARRIRVRR